MQDREQAEFMRQVTSSLHMGPPPTAHSAPFASAAIGGHEDGQTSPKRASSQPPSPQESPKRVAKDRVQFGSQEAADVLTSFLHPQQEGVALQQAQQQQAQQQQQQRHGATSSPAAGLQSRALGGAAFGGRGGASGLAAGQPALQQAQQQQRHGATSSPAAGLQSRALGGAAFGGRGGASGLAAGQPALQQAQQQQRHGATSSPAAGLQSRALGGAAFGLHASVHKRDHPESSAEPSAVVLSELQDSFRRYLTAADATNATEGAVASPAGSPKRPLPPSARERMAAAEPPHKLPATESLTDGLLGLTLAGTGVPASTTEAAASAASPKASGPQATTVEPTAPGSGAAAVPARAPADATPTTSQQQQRQEQIQGSAPSSPSAQQAPPPAAGHASGSAHRRSPATWSALAAKADVKGLVKQVKDGTPFKDLADELTAKLETFGSNYWLGLGIAEGANNRADVDELNRAKCEVVADISPLFDNIDAIFADVAADPGDGQYKTKFGERSMEERLKLVRALARLGWRPDAYIDHLRLLAIMAALELSRAIGKTNARTKVCQVIPPLWAIHSLAKQRGEHVDLATLQLSRQEILLGSFANQEDKEAMAAEAAEKPWEVKRGYTLKHGMVNPTSSWTDLVSSTRARLHHYGTSSRICDVHIFVTYNTAIVEKLAQMECLWTGFVAEREMVVVSLGARAAWAAVASTAAVPSSVWSAAAVEGELRREISTLHTAGRPPIRYSIGGSAPVQLCAPSPGAMRAGPAPAPISLP
ncbi:hypothetical protein N2152v2_006224 [Parachlorella kessleri]